MAGETISQYLHCARCIEEWQRGEAHGKSPQSYSRLSVGFTPQGLQVICFRHDLNVVHIDFEGRQHPADLSEEGDFGASRKNGLN